MVRSAEQAPSLSGAGGEPSSAPEHPLRAGPVRRRGVWVFAAAAAGTLVGLAGVPAAGGMLGAEGPGEFVIVNRMALALGLAGVVCAAFGMALRGRGGAIALLLSLCFAAGAWSAWRGHGASPASLRHALASEPIALTIEGVVTKTPEVVRTHRGTLAPFARFNPQRVRFVVEARRVQTSDGAWRQATGRLLVRINEAEGVEPIAVAGEPVRIGTAVRLTGMATAIRGPSNPGEYDARPTLAKIGVVGSMSMPTAELLEPAAGVNVGALRRVGFAAERWVDGVRADAQRTLNAALGVADADAEAAASSAALDAERRRAALGRALLLGVDDPQLRDLRDAFARTGVAHVLAISGLHLSIVAGMAMLLVRVTGDRPRLEAAAAIAVCVGAMLLIPAKAPIMRAAAIVLAFVIADGFGRRYDRLNTLALVAAAVLVWRPTELFNPGYQLSFGVVAGLIVFADRFGAALHGPGGGPGGMEPLRPMGGAWRRWWWSRWLVGACGASLVAWVVATPIVLTHFGYVSPAGVLLSVVVAPIAAAGLAVGYLAIGLTLVAPAAGDAAGCVLAVVLEAMIAVVVLADRAPGASVMLPPISAVAALSAGVVGCAWFVRRPVLPGRAWFRFARVRAAAGVAALIWVSVEAATGHRLPSASALRLDAIDVGDGSCWLVRSGSEALLYDAGSAYLAIGERELPDAVRALGRTRVRTVVVTHPDIDHYSALPDIAQRLGVERVLVHRRFLKQGAHGADAPEAFVLDRLHALGVRVEEVAAGDELALGSARLRFVWPPAAVNVEADNDASLAALLSVETAGGVRTALLTGDAERSALAGVDAELRALGVNRVDVMNAPHHGSARPFAFSFVAGLEPGLVVQSTGPQRLGDERWDAVKRDRSWLITARDGAISVTFGVDGSITARTWAAPVRTVVVEEAGPD